MKRTKPQRRREKLLKKRFKNKEGLERLGAALAAPIMRQLNYAGIPEGALPEYDEDGEFIDAERRRIEGKGW